MQAHNATMLHALAAEVAAQKEVAAVRAHHAAALKELNSVSLQTNFLGETWQATLRGVTAATVTAAGAALAAGVSQGAVAEAYGLTAAQVRAVGSALQQTQAIEQAATSQSLDASRRRLDFERAVLREMEASASHYTREVLQAQIAKVRELEGAIRGYGDTSAATFRHMRDEVDRTSFTYRNWLANMATDAEKAALGLDKVTAATARATGAVTSVTQDRYSPEEYIAVAARLHTTAEAVRAMVTAGAGSLEEILRAGLAAVRGNSEAALDLWTAMGGATPGSRPPGFAGGVTNFSGGAAWVGERGPELVTLPRGSDVLPFGRGGGGPPVVNHFYVNGTGEEVARQVGDILMRQAKRTTLYGAA